MTDGNAPIAGGTDLDEAGKQAKRRREQLHEATRALAAALDDTSGELDERLTAAREAIVDMQRTILTHVSEAEASDGLLAQIIADEPAYGSRVEEMRREHVALVEDAAVLVENAQAAGSVDELRVPTTEFIELVQRHRHRSAELLLDTYDLDLSAGD